MSSRPTQFVSKTGVGTTGHFLCSNATLTLPSLLYFPTRQEIVFIGTGRMDETAIRQALEACLVTEVRRRLLLQFDARRMGQPTQRATNYTARSNIEPAQIFLHANGQSAPRSGGARDVGRGAGSHTPSTASESLSRSSRSCGRRSNSSRSCSNGWTKLRFVRRSRRACSLR